MEGNIRIFVDTNYFVALYNGYDALHERAKEMAEIIEKQDIQMVFSNFVFFETVTVLSQRRGRRLANSAGEYLLTGAYAEIVHIDEKLHNYSWHIFQEVRDKNVSFVDCSIIAVMHMEDIKALLTFDKTDFKELQKRYHFSLY
jgi:predicted nucleic acid-binding protein